MERLKRIVLSSDASGAYHAAKEGLLVMIVDVIDMSTSLESALDAGAYAVLGASPDYTRAPVSVSPHLIGKQASILAKEAGKGIILLAEPRLGDEKERIARCQKVISGIEKEKGFIEAILPNIGAEVGKMLDMKDRVVIAVTDTGGVAYDAAYTQSQHVFTGTVARTLKQKGIEPAITACKRVIKHLRKQDQGIAIIAASRNSMEDVLAAQYISNLLLQENK